MHAVSMRPFQDFSNVTFDVGKKKIGKTCLVFMCGLLTKLEVKMAKFCRFHRPVVHKILRKKIQPSCPHFGQYITIY